MECFLSFTTALFLVSSMATILPCRSSDRLILGQTISGNQTLVSSRGVFALGFFSPTGDDGPRYVGIWHNHVPLTERKIVWVANREKPVAKPPGIFRFSDDRNLVISDGAGHILWSSNSSTSSSPSVNDTWALLLDTGNLVVRGEGEDVWRSFDHPTDTVLPGMILRLNYRTKVASEVTCWRSDRDPSPGNFSFGLDPATPFQFMLTSGGKPYWRTGAWTGTPSLALPSSRTVMHVTQDMDDEWVNATFTLSKELAPTIGVVNHSGYIQLLQWSEVNKNWMGLYSIPSDICQSYALCGEFGVCYTTVSPHCKCLKGFEPKNRTEWDRGDFHRGCSRKKSLHCEDGATSDRFSAITRIKLPDQLIFFNNFSSSDCIKLCLANCSCTAYIHTDTTEDSKLNGCFLWTGALLDLVNPIFSVTGYPLQVRLAADQGKRTRSKTKTNIIIIAVVTSVSFALICSASLLCCFFTSKRKKSKAESTKEEQGEEELKQEGENLSLFDFEELVAATDNFSDSNRIGQGGFGIVYKGKLTNGLEIAVKRLSKLSKQGFQEFKNEVMMIAKLQHKNLVRLLGYCVQEEEKMLIYEFLQNGSLDSFLFGNNEKRMLLDWEKRFNIIKGIARGLLYLHEDSRLTIIHRDLKASNILLDEDMNPKISDFGMARTFESDYNDANTQRVVGTYGYMSPEYILKGHFSTKLDVYSYGVLVLEILSGKKNNSFRRPSFPTLLSYAWQLWEDKLELELVEPLIVGMCEMEKVSRCMLMALLCVQDNASDRLTMASVVHILENEFVLLNCQPKRPTFMVINQYDMNRDLRVEMPPTLFCTNDVTITELDGR